MYPINSSEISPSELEARLRLHRLPELGSKRFRVLLEAFGSASKAISAPASAWRSLGLPAVSADARRSPEIRDGASEALAWLEQPAQHLLMWDQPEYPALLAQIDDAPPLLFVAGDPKILEKPQLAMVGSRRASRPGMDTAAAFSRSLASAGFVITSGLALGIDGAAHQAALDVGGQTIGVLGTGLENFYPQRHRQLAATMIAQGSAVVSEFPLDASPQAGNFPRRNRIISGLSLGVLVVEASMASGSLITARLAAEQGREVYAIPGSIHHPGAKGCQSIFARHTERNAFRRGRDQPSADAARRHDPQTGLRPVHLAAHGLEGDAQGRSHRSRRNERRRLSGSVDAEHATG